MAKHATILNLVPEADTDEGKLCEILAVESCTVVPGKDVREKGARGGLAYIKSIARKNSSSVIAIHSFDWNHQTQRTGLYGLACLVPTGRRVVVNLSGELVNLTLGGLIFGELPSAVGQVAAGKALRKKAEELIDEGLLGVSEVRNHRILEVKTIAYMRTDLWYGVKAGGSIGHVAGVIDGFKRSGIQVHILSWDRPPLVDESADFTKIESSGNFTNDRECELLSYNDRLIDEGVQALKSTSPDAVYARYALNCYAPVTIARHFNVPLIIEYNGSEVWIEQNWGRGLKYPEISEKIEKWVLESADLITVVSQPLKDELVSRGISDKRVLVNPNSVDPDRFDPSRYDKNELCELNRSLGIPDGKVVAGFIGTFSPWHGVEVLADCIPLALEKCPDLHFLLIGSGPLFNDVKDKLDSAGVLDSVTFTGLVGQDEAPKYLLLSDMFLSPHVPNPDGTPFFGSPTKLFEYMALGKGIIASDLDQLGEILEHENTALLVRPSDPSALATAIERLCSDPGLRSKLGYAAREEALSNHTWEVHVGKIHDALM